jgi:hypothetical protein
MPTVPYIIQNNKLDSPWSPTSEYTYRTGIPRAWGMVPTLWYATPWGYEKYFRQIYKIMNNGDFFFSFFPWLHSPA